MLAVYSHIPPTQILAHRSPLFGLASREWCGVQIVPEFRPEWVVLNGTMIVSLDPTVSRQVTSE